MRAANIFPALVLTLNIFSTHGINEEYYKNEKIPKCCRQGSHYVLKDGTLECADEYTNHIYYQELLLKKDNNSCVECAEVLINGTTAKLIKFDCDGKVVEGLNHNFFPKCCPLGYLYNPKDHKCVNVEEPVKFVGYARVGLSGCKGVIVDYLNFQNFTIDGSLGVKTDKDFNYGDYCWESDRDTGGNVLRACVPFSVCKTKGNSKGITCLPKCCPDGHYMGEKCMSTDSRGINTSHLRFNCSDGHSKKIRCVPIHSRGITTSHLHFEENFALFQAKPKSKWMNKMNNPKLDSFGTLWDENNDYTTEKYCLEQYTTFGQKIFFFADDEPAVEAVKFNFKKVLVTTSCIFFFLTIVSYMLLPEMRENLYGKCVMIYCSIFLFGFAILTYMNFHGNQIHGKPCMVVGFLLVFAFLGTFSWLNIICFDMWMAFGQIRVRTLRSKKSDCKKLIYYNLYGWGIPIFITLFIFGMSVASHLPKYLIPHVGQKECFLEKESGNYSHLVYFIVPITLLVVSNFILFIKTIRYCFQVKDEINRMKDSVPNEKAKKSKSLNADKEKLAMMMKLFVIMGISWLFEILASFISFKANVVLTYIELIVDCLNSLQGFLIFCILVLKRKVLTSLKNKVFKKLIRRPSESSTTMTSVYSYVRNNLNNRNTSETRS